MTQGGLLPSLINFVHPKVHRIYQQGRTSSALLQRMHQNKALGRYSVYLCNTGTRRIYQLNYWLIINGFEIFTFCVSATCNGRPRSCQASWPPLRALFNRARTCIAVSHQFERVVITSSFDSGLVVWKQKQHSPKPLS